MTTAKDIFPEQVSLVPAHSRWTPRPAARTQATGAVFSRQKLLHKTGRGNFISQEAPRPETARREEEHRPPGSEKRDSNAAASLPHPRAAGPEVGPEGALGNALLTGAKRGAFNPGQSFSERTPGPLHISETQVISAGSGKLARARPHVDLGSR